MEEKRTWSLPTHLIAAVLVCAVGSLVGALAGFLVGWIAFFWVVFFNPELATRLVFSVALLGAVVAVIRCVMAAIEAYPCDDCGKKE